jgi:hypothetical protein
MSISPTSERTALLWGRCWWLAGRTQPLDFENLSHAVEVLAAHLSSEPHPMRLRLIYQPESLVTVAVACPRGPRASLQNALAFEHPAIAQPGHAWSHEPILSLGDGFGTYLHYEQEPGLFLLVERLAQRSINVTTVWPLATFLHALPSEWSDSGAVLVVAANLTAAIAYHHPADGSRTLKDWQGDTAAVEANAWLRQAMNDTPRDHALMLFTAEQEAQVEGVKYLPLTDALAIPVILPRAHPAQLLPASPLLTPQRAIVAASILLLLAGGWTGSAYAREFMAWTEGQRTTAHEKSTLRAEIAHYRVNAAEIVSLRAKLAGPGASPPVGELLDAVCGALPPQLALDQIHVAQGRFTLCGHMASGAVTAWEQWRNRIGSNRWTLEPAAAPRDTGAFTVNGVFTP